MFGQRRTRGRVSIGLAVAGLVLAAAGCGGGAGGSADERVELRFSWWGNADRAEITEEAVALFEKENPDIDVVTSFQDYEPYWQRIATEVAGGGSPDVFQMDYSYLREYADRGALLDLKQFAGGPLDVDGFVPGLEESGVVNDELVAVPWSANTFATMYIPAEYEKASVKPPEAGITWDEFDQRIAEFNGEQTGMYGAADYTNVFYVFEIQLRQNGGVMFTEEGELGFEPAQLAEFWRHGQELQKSGATVPVKKAVEAQPVSSLGAGLTASEMSWDNFMVRYVGEQDQEVAIAPLPSGGEEFGQYVKPAMMLSAAASTEHPEEAARLIDFLLNDPEAAAILGADRGLPATQAARDAAELEGVDAKVAEYEASIADELEPTPVTPPKGAGSLEAAFIRIHEEIAYGSISVEQGVEQFFNEADRLLGG